MRTNRGLVERRALWGPGRIPWLGFVVTLFALWLASASDSLAQMDTTASTENQTRSGVVADGGKLQPTEPYSNDQAEPSSDSATGLTEEYAFEAQPIAQETPHPIPESAYSSSVRPDHRLEATRLRVKTEIEALHKETEHKMRRDGLQYGIAMALIVSVPITVGILLWTLARHQHSRTADLVNGTGLVLIIFAIIFVVVIADDDRQLTTSIGVLGTIAGYLFGSYVGARRNDISPATGPAAPAPNPKISKSSPEGD